MLGVSNLIRGNRSRVPSGASSVDEEPVEVDSPIIDEDKEPNAVGQDDFTLVAGASAVVEHMYNEMLATYPSTSTVVGSVLSAAAGNTEAPSPSRRSTDSPGFNDDDWVENFGEESEAMDKPKSPVGAPIVDGDASGGASTADDFVEIDVGGSSVRDGLTAAVGNTEAPSPSRRSTASPGFNDDDWVENFGEESEARDKPRSPVGAPIVDGDASGGASAVLGTAALVSLVESFEAQPTDDVVAEPGNELDEGASKIGARADLEDTFAVEADTTDGDRAETVREPVSEGREASSGGASVIVTAVEAPSKPVVGAFTAALIGARADLEDTFAVEADTTDGDRAETVREPVSEGREASSGGASVIVTAVEAPSKPVIGAFTAALIGAKVYLEDTFVIEADTTTGGDGAETVREPVSEGSESSSAGAGVTVTAAETPSKPVVGAFTAASNKAGKHKKQRGNKRK